MIKRIVNKILRHYEINNVPEVDKVVYLTFDDGPEGGITQFVLDELEKYGFKATFFCRGDNAEKHPELLKMICAKGHRIGNHTQSHLHAYKVESGVYYNDVMRANNMLKTTLFRPPHGSLTLRTFLKLHRQFRIVFWSLNSGDSDMDRFDYEKSFVNLNQRTKPGAIVLFHFCHKHERETIQLLPRYLKWLNENGYSSKGLK